MFFRVAESQLHLLKSVPPAGMLTPLRKAHGNGYCCSSSVVASVSHSSVSLTGKNITYIPFITCMQFSQ